LHAVSPPQRVPFQPAGSAHANASRSPTRPVALNGKRRLDFDLPPGGVSGTATWPGYYPPGQAPPTFAELLATMPTDESGAFDDFPIFAPSTSAPYLTTPLSSGNPLIDPQSSHRPPAPAATMASVPSVPYSPTGSSTNGHSMTSLPPAALHPNGPSNGHSRGGNGLNVLSPTTKHSTASNSGGLAHHQPTPSSHHQPSAHHYHHPSTNAKNSNPTMNAPHNGSYHSRPQNANVPRLNQVRLTVASPPASLHRFSPFCL